MNFIFTPILLISLLFICSEAYFIYHSKSAQKKYNSLERVKFISSAIVKTGKFSSNFPKNDSHTSKYYLVNMLQNAKPTDSALFKRKVVNSPQNGRRNGQHIVLSLTSRVKIIRNGWTISINPHKSYSRLSGMNSFSLTMFNPWPFLTNFP
jgi:hypothetical protein